MFLNLVSLDSVTISDDDQSCNSSQKAASSSTPSSWLLGDHHHNWAFHPIEKGAVSYQDSSRPAKPLLEIQPLICPLLLGKKCGITVAVVGFDPSIIEDKWAWSKVLGNLSWRNVIITENCNVPFWRNHFCECIVDALLD